MYDRLGKLKLSPRILDDVEVDKLIVQAKPAKDENDLLPVCYRCGAVNPLLNPGINRLAKGDACTSCCHPFIRSFINFDLLPLVEFTPEAKISAEEAIELIRQPHERRRSRMRGRNWREEKQGGADTLKLDGDDDDGDDEGGGSDSFSKCINKSLEKQVLQHFNVKTYAL